MHHYSKKFLFALSLLAATSCTKNFEEINTNPNSPIDVPAQYILLTAMQSGARTIGGADMNLTYGSTWSQQIAKIQYIDEDWYQFRPATIDNFWAGLYAGPLNDLNLVIKKTQSTGFKNTEAAARIMRAYIFQTMTDIWGDIPYSEALTLDEGGTAQPKYDSQQSIYMDLLNELKTASEMLGTGEDDFSAGDNIYGGDTDSWKRFANSLRLRLYMRMSGVDASTAKAGIEGILSNTGQYPIFSSNGDDAQFAWLGGQPYRNPIFENGVTRDDHAVSAVMVGNLLDREDPRIEVYAHPAASDGQYHGQPNGALGQPVLSTVSRIGSMYRDSPTAPTYMMTYAEVQFIIAEAALNGWNVGKTAKAAYEDGIRASMYKNGITNADAISTYLAGDLVNFDRQSDKYEAVGTQKWIALFMQGIEAFSEYRRTGYPSEIEEVPGSKYPGLGIPYRFPYPGSESLTNGANFSQAIAGVVSDMYGQKMWWDVN